MYLGFFNDSSVADLLQEILKMKDFSHKNILTLIGVALDSRNSPCLVMPFMPNGSLCEYLRKDNVRKELLWGRDQPVEMVVRREEGGSKGDEGRGGWGIASASDSRNLLSL